MTLRSAALVAAVATLAIGVPAATAAPKKKAPPPVCNLVVDDKGDETVPDPTLDVLSADIASDARKITGVIRLSGDPDSTSPTSPTGRTYNLMFSGTKPTNPVFFAFILGPTAQAATYGFRNTTTNVNEGVGEATVKIVGNDIYMTAPLSAFAPYGKFKPGNKITGLTAATGRMLGAFASSSVYAYNSVAGDATSEGRTYTAGTRSCVKVGGP